MPATGDRLEAALEALPVAVVVVDDAGRLGHANARARELLSVQAGDALPPYLESVVDRSRACGAVVREAVDVRNGAALPAVVEVWAAAIDGGVVCSLEDLTERARRERADREFITNAAHQLRTPLTAIATAIEVLQGGAKEKAETRDRFLDHIELQTQRLVRLMRAMLTLSRAERLDVVPTLGPVALSPLLEALVADADHAAISIEVECPADARVLADADLLTEALANLLGNALEYTLAGGVRIGVTIAERAVTIAVADTGPGIAPVELSRVFERFHRGDHAREGAGLGLSIARAAVQALGGSLELESREGAGTTAFMRLRAP
jgi:two-component system phosphate regulon sensor histidine kinase PhoR